MYRDYFSEYRPVVFIQLVLSGILWTYLADINEQAQQRIVVLIRPMKSDEGVTEELKIADQMKWGRQMNGIRNRSEEAVLSEIVYK